MGKQGQRFLLALNSATEDADEFLEKLSLEEILIAVGGAMCLIFVVLMCTCKKEERKAGDEIELNQSSRKGEKKSTVQQSQDFGDVKSRTDVEVVAVNGGTAQTSSTLPGHSRQASSGSAHMRPTSLRELPEPPVSSHHSRNKSMSAVETLNLSVKGATGAAVSGSSSVDSGGGGGGGGDFSYHQHPHPARTTKSVPSVTVTASIDKDQQRHSDGYDHLGPKRGIKPTDYDSLAEPESTDGETPVSETSGVLDGHYSQLRERTYAVVGDVKARAKELFDPYSNVKDKDDGSSDYYSQVKEDPYNDIDDSDGSVSTSFIHRLRQSQDDADDLYSTVQDSSRAGLKKVLEPRVATRVPPSRPPKLIRKHTMPAAEPNDGEAEEEYAVVQKAKGALDQATDKSGQPYRDGDMSPYSAGPPEPPRLYNDYDSVGSSTPSTYSSEHKYSKVTARESLASMSARNALNPYEMVMDLPENTYATVDGGSGDGVVLRGGAVPCDSTENRLSQASDTYAEIGMSGVVLSSSIVSSSSSTGGNNNSSSSSVAPVPPSLDSLHLMTKSQTSSEGDRLSDRHLASPEDSAMSLNLWADSHDDEDSDGYSTLKKPDSPPQNAHLPAICDSPLVGDDSREVILANYQTVKDCISDTEAMEEAENDPNYESVEEMRAKVAQLKAKTSSLDFRTSPFNSQPGSSKPLCTGLNTNSSLNMAGNTLANKEDSTSSHRRRRVVDHDYEEVDISPPSSPVTPSSSMSHSASSNYQVTSISSVNYAVTSAQTATEAILDVTEVRERVIQSHMYEELTEVRAKTSAMSRDRKSHSLGKNSSKGKTSDKKSDEKGKNSAESKKKVVSEDKQKVGAEDKQKVSSEKKKGDDKRKNAEAEKKKEEKRKSGADKKKEQAVVNGTRL